MPLGPGITTGRQYDQLPDLPMPIVVNNTLVMDTPTQADARVTPTRASGTITVTATGADGDSVLAVIDGVTVIFTKTAAETTTALMAAALADAINKNANLAGKVRATVATNVITLKAVLGGPGGNGITLDTTITGAATSTKSGTAFTGGIGLIYPSEDFALQVPNASGVGSYSTIALKEGQPVLLPKAAEAALLASGKYRKS